MEAITKYLRLKVSLEGKYGSTLFPVKHLIEKKRFYCIMKEEELWDCKIQRKKYYFEFISI